MYRNGLPLIVAAANGCSNTIHFLVCGGAHGEAMQIASNILIANGHMQDVQYLAKWANMYVAMGWSPS